MEAGVADPPGMVRTLDRVVGACSLAAVVLACVWITVLMLWIVGDVLGRTLEISGITGTVAMAADSVVAISFLCIPYAMRRGGHIRSTILVDRFPASVASWLLAVSQVLGVLIFAFVAWSSWEPMMASWASGEYSGEGSLRIPTAPFRTVVVAASALMALECGLAAVRAVFAARSEAGGTGRE